MTASVELAIVILFILCPPSIRIYNLYHVSRPVRLAAVVHLSSPNVPQTFNCMLDNGRARSAQAFAVRIAPPPVL